MRLLGQIENCEERQNISQIIEISAKLIFYHFRILTRVWPKLDFCLAAKLEILVKDQTLANVFVQTRHFGHKNKFSSKLNILEILTKKPFQ